MTFAEMTRQAEAVVTGLQAELPVEIRSLAHGVPVHYKRLPAADVLVEGFEPDILGLFSGNPHGTEISHADPAPPQISLYLENIMDWAEGDPAGFAEEVRLTYLHELGHFLGWDEDDLAARGLD